MVRLTSVRSIDAKDLAATVKSSSDVFASVSIIPNSVVYSAANVSSLAVFESFLEDENQGDIVVNAFLDPGSPGKPESLLELGETEIGFIQFLRLEEFVVRYAGVTSNAGAVRIEPFKTLPAVFPDSGGARKPWTKQKKDRIFRTRKATSIYVSNDQPSWRMPLSLHNSKTNGAQNFLQSWRWKFKILTAFTRHSPACNEDGIGPKLVLASSEWNFDFDCTFKWRDGEIQFDKKMLNRKLSDFVFDPPKNQEFQSIYALFNDSNRLSESFLLNRDFNDFGNEAVRKAMRSASDPGREELESWMSSIPEDFYKNKK
jgi:hypothetical protein